MASADRLDGVLRPTRDLLQAGRISPDRARLIIDMLWAYDDRIAAGVQERVPPRAPGLAWGQLRPTITRAIIAVVPDAEHRHRRARRERRVDLHPGQDGMATLSALLTAAEATASFEWVTRLARGVQPAPDKDGTGKRSGSGVDGSAPRRRAGGDAHRPSRRDHHQYRRCSCSRCRRSRRCRLDGRLSDPRHCR